MSTESSPSETTPASEKPLVFISHDSRDAELAEAFSGLINKASMGMLKAFRSSDTKGVEGIEFGGEWYTRIMSGLGIASDVVCLFTEKSINRPWILFEAGVAKGRLDRPVLGIALGIELSKISTGPFFQFQNCGDDENSLTGLMMQLCKRIPGADPNEDVTRMLVREFRDSVQSILQSNKSVQNVKQKSNPEEAAIAKILEEMKLMVRELPRYFDEMASGARLKGGVVYRKRFSCGTFSDVMNQSSVGKVPLALLVVAGYYKVDFPWFYDLAMEYYKAISDGDRILAAERLRELIGAVDWARNNSVLCRDSRFESGIMSLLEIVSMLEREFSVFTHEWKGLDLAKAKVSKKSEVLPDDF